MCREREVERELGGNRDIDTLPSVQPPTVKRSLVGGGSPNKPPNKSWPLRVVASPNSVKEEQERGVPVVARKTSSQSPRLLPYFPKPGVTSPPPPLSLARNSDPSPRSISVSSSPLPPSKVASSSPVPSSKATARTPSPTPSSTRAQASPSPISASKATLRNPSPAPPVRSAPRNPSPAPATSRPINPPSLISRSAPRNPSPTPAPRTTPRNPSPTPAPTTTPRNPSPSPAPRASARTPSPGPALKASARNAAAAAKPAARNPSPAVKSSARSASPAPPSKPSTPAASKTPTDSGILTPLVPLSNNSKIARRPASPASTRRGSFRADNGGSKIITEDTEKRKDQYIVDSPSNVMAPSVRIAPKSSLDVSKSFKGGAVQSSVESAIMSLKKLSAVELQALKKERISGYGRKAGGPKAGRVACEGMLPTSPTMQTDWRKRCSWVTPQSEADLVEYHDEDWGVPVHDDKLLFEHLVLEGAQAELSRPQILSMRDYFREVLGGFDPEVVAKFDEKKIAALIQDERIRQPEAKIRGVIENAKQVLKIIQEFGSFDKYVWTFVGFKPIVNTPRNFTQVPVKSSKSETLSKDLMRRGFRYVGPTTVYSFMQAAGMVNDHLVSCFRHSECCAISQLQVADSSISNGSKKG